MNYKHSSSQGASSKDKIDWLNILHLHQPPFQYDEIIRQVTEECYLPVCCLLREKPHAKAIVNINGCLIGSLYTFPEGKDVIEDLKTLAYLRRAALQPYYDGGRRPDKDKF